MSYYGISPLSFESVSAVTATPTPGLDLGTERIVAGEKYRYVYSLGQISPGYGATYSGTSGNSVAATGVVSGEHCAGFCKHATLTTGTYGWLLVKGVVDSYNGMTNSAPADGDVVYLTTDGKFRSGKGAPATSATDFVGGYAVGKVLSAGASGGTGASLSLLFVNVP